MPDAPILSQQERMGLFFGRLRDHPAAATHDEAFEMLSKILNTVEDECSGVAFDPQKHRSDGRLYPPQSDNKHTVPGQADVVRYRSRKHYTWISANGAIRIEPIDGSEVRVDKPGADGKTVQL